MPLPTHVIKTLHLHSITSFYDVMTSLMMSSHTCVAGHMTFQYKRGHTWWGLVLLPKTFKRSDRSKHTLVVTHQVHPCNWSLLSSTVLSTFNCVLLPCMFQYTCSSVPGKPGSAAHSTSTASTGLLCLSVGARVPICHAHHIYTISS